MRRGMENYILRQLRSYVKLYLLIDCWHFIFMQGNFMAGRDEHGKKFYDLGTSHHSTL